MKIDDRILLIETFLKLINIIQVLLKMKLQQNNYYLLKNKNSQEDDALLPFTPFCDVEKYFINNYRCKYNLNDY